VIRRDKQRANILPYIGNLDGGEPYLTARQLSCMGCLKYFDRWGNISTTRRSLHFKLYRDLQRCLTNIPVFFSWIKEKYFSCWRTSGAHKSMFWEFKMRVNRMSHQSSSRHRLLLTTLSAVRSGSGPGIFCGPWTRTSRSGPLKPDLDPVRLRPGPGGPVQVRSRFGPGPSQ